MSDDREGRFRPFGKGFDTGDGNAGATRPFIDRISVRVRRKEARIPQ
jgi:hypothetical protein